MTGLERSAAAGGAAGTAPQVCPALPAWLWAGLPALLALLLWGGPWVAPELYRPFVAGEGPVELLQFAILLGCVAASLRLRRLAAVRRSRPISLWVWLALLGSIYTAGEEVSWGQHLVGWETPETLIALNDQNETNLHNLAGIGALLDQLPRLLLSLFALVGGILLPLALRARPHLLPPALAHLRPLLPSLACLPAALLALTTRLPAWLLPGLVAHGYSPGEAKELFLYLFVLLYLLGLHRRLARGGRGLTSGQAGAGASRL